MNGFCRLPAAGPGTVCADTRLCDGSRGWEEGKIKMQTEKGPYFAEVHGLIEVAMRQQ